MMLKATFLALFFLYTVDALKKSKSDMDIEDSIDNKYWDVIKGYQDLGNDGTQYILFENIFTCNLCHAIVDHVRPLLKEKKVNEEVLKEKMRKKFCTKTINSITDHDTSLSPKVKSDLKKKICQRIVTENLVDIFTTIAVMDEGKEKDNVYICENTYPALCQSWLRGTSIKQTNMGNEL